ncbi:MAG TPA: ABC transporter permease [Solirubrobacteraceae bacterium]|nr:ABC transporter permease [Solirubrobacteraceae bacterium]
MSSLAYTRFELRRTFRSRRLLAFTFGFPLILYFVLAAPNQNEHNFNGSGISIPLYYMVGLVAFGAMTALISSGARIALERTDGWTRQLRITPLKPSAYFRAKVVTGYAIAGATIVVLYASGISLGVSLGAGRWLEMTGLILVALVPFAALGIFLGHVLTADSLGPAVGGLTSLLALVSGTWFPLGSHGFLYDIAQFLPSYWLVRASHVSLGGHAWTAGGWIVVAAWTLVLAVLARYAYLRDTARV